MSHYVRDRVFTLQGKISMDVRITVTDRTYSARVRPDGDYSINYSLFPIVSVNIYRPADTAWDPNSNLGLTKYDMYYLVNELEEMIRSFRIPEMFVLTDDRLDLNIALAEQHRRVFNLSQRTIELSMVVIEDEKQERHEGIKFKINNESNSVTFTAQEFMSFYMCLKHLNVDTLAMLMYIEFMKTRNHVVNVSNTSSSTVDIQPKASATPYQGPITSISTTPAPMQSIPAPVTEPSAPSPVSEIGTELPF